MKRMMCSVWDTPNKTLRNFFSILVERIKSNISAHSLSMETLKIFHTNNEADFECRREDWFWMSKGAQNAIKNYKAAATGMGESVGMGMQPKIDWNLNKWLLASSCFTALTQRCHMKQEFVGCCRVLQSNLEIPAGTHPENKSRKYECKRD